MEYIPLSSFLCVFGLFLYCFMGFKFSSFSLVNCARNALSYTFFGYRMWYILFKYLAMKVPIIVPLLGKKFLSPIMIFSIIQLTISIYGKILGHVAIRCRNYSVTSSVVVSKESKASTIASRSTLWGFSSWNNFYIYL